jgi:hypothetical protein
MITMFLAFVIYGCFFNILGHWCQKNSLNSWVAHDGNFGIIGDMDAHM